MSNVKLGKQRLGRTGAAAAIMPMNGKLRRPEKPYARALIGAAAAMAVLATAPAAWPQPAKTLAVPLLKVTVQIRAYGDQNNRTNANLLGVPAVRAFFKPSLLHVGTVVMVVRNFDSDWQTLSVNGVQSRPMGPNGGTAVMKVTFKRPGIYSVGLDSENAGYGGTVKVIK